MFSKNVKSYRNVCKNWLFREGFQKKINYFHGIFHGRGVGGTPHPSKWLIFWKKYSGVKKPLNLFKIVWNLKILDGNYWYHTQCVAGRLDHKTDFVTIFFWSPSLSLYWTVNKLISIPTCMENTLAQQICELEICSLHENGVEFCPEMQW